MKNYILLLVNFLAVAILYSQEWQLSGKVVSAAKEPLSNVNVTLTGTPYGGTTRSDGSFQIGGVPRGKYTLRATSVGYETYEISVSVIPTEAIKVPLIVLKERQEQLSEVVVEGSRKEYITREPSESLRLKTELAQLPQNIQVVSGELLDDQQAFTMMESITRNVSGAQMIEHWGHFARVNMRGFRIPAFRNGMNLLMSWGPLAEDMSMVERIEFVKGPAGFMLAAGEPGGFYNVVTKKPIMDTFGEVSLATGNYNTYRGTVDFGSHSGDGRLKYRLNAMVQSQESHRDFEESSRVSLVPSLTYEFGEQTTVTTEFTYQQSSTPIGAAYVFAPVSVGFGGLNRDFTAIDTNFPNTDIEEIGVTTHLTQALGTNWELHGQHAYIRYEQEGFSPWPVSVEDNGDIIRGVSIWDALGISNIGQIYLNGELQTGGISHTLLAGFDYNQREYWADWAQGGSIDDPANPFNIFDPQYGNAVMPEVDRSEAIKVRGAGGNQGINSRGYYLQDEIGFFRDKARLTLAGRYTDANLFAYGNSAEASKFTPRIGLSVDITPSTVVYGLYDQAFLPQTGLSASGEAFDPQEGIAVEAGVKKSWFGDRLKTSVSLYQITKQNILVGDPENINFSVQLGEVQSEGLEFDLQGKVTPEINIVLNYANTDVRITADTEAENIGNRVAGHARHITNGWVNYSFPEFSLMNGFGVSLGYQYQADRSSWNWGAGNEAVLPDYFRLDGGLAWENRHLRVQLNIYNILDEHLFSGSSYGSYVYWQSEPGVNGRLSLTYTF
jgi:iron complex outermembrane receptor protein